MRQHQTVTAFPSPSPDSSQSVLSELARAGTEHFSLRLSVGEDRAIFPLVALVCSQVSYYFFILCSARKCVRLCVCAWHFGRKKGVL